MKTIKLKKAFPGYTENQVVEVDDASAAVLIKRGDAAAVDNAPPKVLNLAGDPVEVVDAPAAADSSPATTPPAVDSAAGKGKA